MRPPLAAVLRFGVSLSTSDARVTILFHGPVVTSSVDPPAAARQSASTPP